MPPTPPHPVGIDFLIPYVGRPDYLREAVLSVLAQADEACRVVVVEDGPQGHDVGSWLAGLDDPRVHHVLNPEPLGVAANFQHCVDLARSDWLVIVGCDDAVRPDYLRAVRTAIAAYPRVAAVLPGVEVMDADGASSTTLVDRVKSCLAPRATAVSRWQGDRFLASLLHGNWAYFPSICWRTDVVRRLGFRADLDVTLDLALLADVLLAGEGVATVPEKVFRYRRHAASASSLSARATARFREEARLFEEVGARCDSMAWRRSARAARWHLTSRLHAVCLAASPGAGGTRPSLMRHALSR